MAPDVAGSIAGVPLGQLAIATDAVPTYIGVGYAHGLALLGVLGMAFVMTLLGIKTEQNERTLAEREQAERDVRATVSVLAATLDATADGILVVGTDGAIVEYNAQFVEMWQLPKHLLRRGDD